MIPKRLLVRMFSQMVVAVGGVSLKREEVCVFACFLPTMVHCDLHTKQGVRDAQLLYFLSNTCIPGMRRASHDRLSMADQGRMTSPPTFVFITASVSRPSSISSAETYNFYRFLIMFAR